MKAGQITSFSPVDDRFEYTRKGIYRGMINNESIIVIAVSAAVVLILSGLLTFLFGSEITINNSLAATVFDFVGYICIIALPFVYIGALRTILSGEQYSFTADKTKMLIVCPRKNFRADIFYEDVRRVEYSDILLFRKHRGYNITVVCTSGEQIFTYLFPYKTHKKDRDMTPFRIIEERAGLLEKTEYVAGRRIDL